MPKYIIILLFTLSGINPVHAADKLDMLSIFDQFITSGAATSQCEKPSKETLTKFLANFQMVSILASKKLKEQYPKATSQNIEQAKNQRTEQITTKVEEIIGKKGCDNPDVQEIIKRFYVQAEWKPGQ